MLFALLFASCLAASPAPALQSGSITVDAGRGPVTVDLPVGYDPLEPAPLVVLLHGYGASGPGQESYMRFRPLQDQYGFLYCTPSGTPNALGARFWNATDACCDFQNTGTDDSGYLRALIEAIEAAASVDPRSIHIIGHSNGGFMAYRMACEHSDKIASIASLAGATFSDPMDCTAGGPVHVLQIHGTSDGTIGYGGGSIFGSSYPGAVGTTDRWATRNGCGATVEFTPGALNLDASVAGAESSITRYVDGCSSGGSVELWTIPGGSHSPNLTQAFRTGVIEHLLARPKPGMDATSFCGPANPNSSGVGATIEALGSDVVVDGALTLEASGLPAMSFGYFLNSQTTAAPVVPPGSQGLNCLGGQVGRFSLNVLNSGVMGSFSLDVDLTSIPNNPPQSAMAGETWSFQAWFRDANPGLTSNWTDGISVTFR